MLGARKIVVWSVKSNEKFILSALEIYLATDDESSLCNDAKLTKCNLCVFQHNPVAFLGHANVHLAGFPQPEKVMENT